MSISQFVEQKLWLSRKFMCDQIQNSDINEFGHTLLLSQT
jgi:hypothetical protein